MKELNYKQLLFDFILDLTLADHLGDVMNDVESVMREAGLEQYKDDWLDGGFSNYVKTVLSDDADAKFTHERPDGFYLKGAGDV